MSKRGNGEGSISKRPDGRWMAQITTGRDINSGKLIRETKYFKIRRKAQNWLAETVHELRTGTYVHPDKTTIGEWIDIWLKTYVLTRVRPNTYANYIHKVNTQIKSKALSKIARLL